jgi:hypothetical protein
MKRQFTLLSGLLLLAGTTMSQNNTTLVSSAKLTKTPNKISPFNGVIKDANTGSTKALGAILWESDFSTPADWTIGTSGQGTFEIGTGAAALTQYMGAMASTTAANGFGFFNGIQYLLNSSATAQNTWIATESINFTGNAYAEITFEQRYRAFNTDVTYVEFSADGGATWTTQEVNAAAVGNGPGTQSTLNLVFPVNNATNGIFRFRWENTSTDGDLGSGYGWAIDDVKVRELAEYDLAATYNFHHVVQYQYSRTPLAQVQPVVFRAGIKNQGSENLTGVKLALNVNSGAATPESPAVTIASIAVDTLEASYTPSAVGTYSVAQALVLNETDDNVANNAIPSASFEVTNYIYSVDKGTTYSEYPLTGLSFGGVAVNIDGVGISFDVYANQDIHAIDFRLYTGTTVGSEVYGELYKINPNAASLDQFWGSPIAETNMFTLNNASQINSIHTLPFTAPFTLEAGETYLVLLKIASGTVKIAAAGETETSQSWLSGDHTNKWGTFSDVPVVRANFDPSAGIKDNEFVTGVSMFPNPATEKATVEFNLANASNVAIEVIDITGKVVATKTLTNASAGANAVELNVAGFSTGIYSVAIKSNDTSVTRKLIVQ